MSTNVHDDVLKHYSTVARLIHYTSKFVSSDDGHWGKYFSAPQYSRLLSTSDLNESDMFCPKTIYSKKMSVLNPTKSTTTKSADHRNIRFAPLWPEWNDADVNSESWDIPIVRRRETNVTRTRPDPKAPLSTGSHFFDDPDGKIELPPSLKVDQWKRPIDFIPTDKPVMIVDPDVGIHTFDLITPNEHLHHSETMRNIIGQITTLWDICRRQRKNPSTSSDQQLLERTWRPWEHIYALTKVSKQPSIPPVNPAGKYVVRLFFLGCWRKIIVDDTMPFDEKNRCLLPQTSLTYEIWPMLLSKALLKIISLDFNPSSQYPEHNETTVLHALTGWIPEPIPLKYGHAEKVWNFLRYDRSSKVPIEQEPQSPSSAGPLPLFQWPEIPVDKPEGTQMSKEHLKDLSNPSDDQRLKKSDERNNVNKGLVPPTATLSKALSSIKEKKVNPNPNNPSSSNVSTTTKTKKILSNNLTMSTDDLTSITDDQNIPEAPKMLIFATVSHSQPTRLSSYSETADRSERLRHYNINETFSTSMFLTGIRDIPLERPPPEEPIPAWKLIRPRKPMALPNADPTTLETPKPKRWIEITSPYINYPTSPALNVEINDLPPASKESSFHRTPTGFVREKNILEVDEDDEMKTQKLKEPNAEPRRSNISLPANLSQPQISEIAEKFKTRRKSVVSIAKFLLETTSAKTKAPDNGPNSTPVETPQRPNFVVPKIWMDFDDFRACFTSIIIFHNPRHYRFVQKHTDVKFVAHQQPVSTPVTRDRRRDTPQSTAQVVPNLPDDKSSLYLFVDSSPETMHKNLEFIVSLTCLCRWYDAPSSEPSSTSSHEAKLRASSGSAEKFSLDSTSSKAIISQKDILPQVGSMIAEVHSWKSLSMGQPILRLHTTATKAAILTLPPGRHVIKFSNTCLLAAHLQVLSDTQDFILADEDSLLKRVAAVPEDLDFLIRAEELFLALDDAIDNFHCVEQSKSRLFDLFRSYCQRAPKSLELTPETCIRLFHQSLYSMLRTILTASSSPIIPNVQHAWRCFTNDLLTPDILGIFRSRRSSGAGATRSVARTVATSVPHVGPSTSSRRTGGGKDKNSDEKNNPKVQSSLIVDSQDATFEWLSHEMSNQELEAIENIQRIGRGFLQRRVISARTLGTEKNLHTQRLLQASMSVIKHERMKAALHLFKHFISLQPQLVECFQFSRDDWNMVSYRDYHGTYQEPVNNTWFILCREIFYVTDESFVAAKFLSNLPNSLLRVINNDTYEEMPLVFNRVAPGIFRKNKFGYTFVVEGLSSDQGTTHRDFRLRLLTSYVRLPEPGNNQVTSTFLTREMIDYYIPNQQQIICRHRVNVSDDLYQTGRHFHLASIHFNTSNSNAFVRLSVFDHQEEIVSVEGKGSVSLPAVLFMRNIYSTSQSQLLTRPTSKTIPDLRRREGSGRRRGSVVEPLTTSINRSGSGKRPRSVGRTELLSIDEDEKIHKYVIQVTLLRKTWPLTPTQWQFVEHLKEQEENDLKVFNRQPSAAKSEESGSTKRIGQINHTSSPSPISKGRGGGLGRIGTPTRRTTTSDKKFDTTKAHWTLCVVSDVDKADELRVKKDTERQDELINEKKAWETHQVGRAQKALESRQKFLESFHVKIDDRPSTGTTDATIERVDTPLTDEGTKFNAPSSSDIQDSVPASPVHLTHKRTGSSSASRKGFLLKTIEIPPATPVNEPLLNEPPSMPPKVLLPPMDFHSFTKQKTQSNQPVILDSSMEEDEAERRRNEVIQHEKFVDEMNHFRQVEQKNLYEEKLRHLTQYIELQSKVDETRRSMIESREAFRQRFLEVERERLVTLAVKEQKFIDQSKRQTSSRKRSSREKKKRI